MRDTKEITAHRQPCCDRAAVEKAALAMGEYMQRLFDTAKAVMAGMAASPDWNGPLLKHDFEKQAFDAAERLLAEWAKRGGALVPNRNTP